MLKLILSIFSVIFLGINAFPAAGSLLNEADREFVLRTLSKVSEELEITAQGFRHCCQAFKNSNRAVDADLVEAMVEDAEQVSSGRVSHSFEVVTRLAREEMQKPSIKKMELRKRILAVKSVLRTNLEERDSEGGRKQIRLLASSLGFEGDAPSLFLRTLSTYKQDSLGLFTGALDEIFQSLSPMVASVRSAPPAEPVVEEEVQKKKSKKKKKKKGKKKEKLGTSAQPGEESEEEKNEGEEEEDAAGAGAGAGAGATDRSVVEASLEGGAAAAVKELGARVKEMLHQEKDADDNQKDIESTPPPMAWAKKKVLQTSEEQQALELPSKKMRLLAETFEAIWSIDCRVNAKEFVIFWENFGFVNTQRAALGNGFFVLQHPNGYKLKTSHAPHSKDEKVFKMALSFAKNLLGSAGIIDVHDAAWQSKLAGFLAQPCEGMRR